MIIECPACATRYEVPDGAIGSGGRNVRCAKCHHSWHAFAVGQEPDGARSLAEPVPTEREDEVGAEVEIGAGREQAPRVRSVSLPVADANLPGATLDAGRAQLPAAPHEVRVEVPAEAEAEPRAGRAQRLWISAAIIVVVVIAAALLAVRAWGLPGWVPGQHATFAQAPTELQLDFPDDQQGMRQLPNGTEFFGASGTITNAGNAVRQVPPILIVLRDSQERIVYSWEVVPPKRSLAPGESVAINEAVTDVPRSAHFADIGWKPS